MLILEASNIRKYYRDRLIIGFDGLKVYAGDKIGIVGLNGSGKTTLLNILSGDLEPDEGIVRRFCEINYIRQFADEDIQAGQKLLKEFSLAAKSAQTVFSGGEKTRIKIANALSSGKLVLFADEPTSNLDYKGMELLRQKLTEVDTFLLISHDRLLLDELCNKILEIRDGKLKLYNGNYSSYKEQSDEEFERAGQEYEKYVEARINLEEAIKDRQSRSKAMKKTPSRMGNSEARLHKRSTTERQQKLNNAVNSLKTRLDKLEVKEKPRELPKIKLDFSLTEPPENRIVISADKLTFSYDGRRRIFDKAAFKIYNGTKTALWGENGSGKTTLLNLISGKQDSGDLKNNVRDSIYIVPRARIGYFCQGFENLDYDRTVLENVMNGSVQSQTVARTILARLLIMGDDVYKKTGVLSGGERIKTAFAKLFVSNANVLLLDEPTNYLDMQSIEALEGVLKDYEGTVVFVSHDKAFVNSVADRLLVLDNQVLSEFEGKLEKFEQSRRKDIAAEAGEMERMALQMRIADTVAKLGRPDADREALEAEYRRLLLQLGQQADNS